MKMKGRSTGFWGNLIEFYFGIMWASSFLRWMKTLLNVNWNKNVNQQMTTCAGFFIGKI